MVFSFFWGSLFYLFSMVGIHMATEWGRSPVLARRALVTGYFFEILVLLILVLVAGILVADRFSGRAGKPRNAAILLLLWAGLSVPGSLVVFILSAACLYLAGILTGAELPALTGVNWFVAWAITTVLSILAAISSTGLFLLGRSGKTGGQ